MSESGECTTGSSAGYYTFSSSGASDDNNNNSRHHHGGGPYICGHTMPRARRNKSTIISIQLGRRIPSASGNPLQPCRDCHWRMMFLTDQAIQREGKERRGQLRSSYGAMYVATFDRLGADDLDEWSYVWTLETISKMMDVNSWVTEKKKAMSLDWADKWGKPTPEEMEMWEAWTTEAEADSEANDWWWN